MSRPRSIVGLETGMVGNVLTNIQEAEVILVDWEADQEKHYPVRRGKDFPGRSALYRCGQQPSSGTASQR